MTFSIVARSEDGSELGVAVASKFLAVGAAVPAAAVGAGAVATQAMANLAYRPRGLALLAAAATRATCSPPCSARTPVTSTGRPVSSTRAVAPRRSPARPASRGPAAPAA